jgi:hypothetical protein
MKFFLVFVAVAAMAPAQDSPAVTQARQHLELVRQQVAKDLLPPGKLAEAQTALDDASDEAVLERTLYGHVEIQDLTEAQATEMTAAAERRVERAQADVDRRKKLISEDVAPRNYAVDAEAEVGRRQQTLAQAKARGELIAEIAAVVHAEIDAKPLRGSNRGPGEVYVDGSHGLLTSKDIKDVTLAFEKKFDKPLPVSARGETAVHRALGFDHTGRIDVALLPDSVEGVWLQRYLESKDIPFYAFRVAIAGKATGAHIHVGPGSTRLPSTD